MFFANNIHKSDSTHWTLNLFFYLWQPSAWDSFSTFSSLLKGQPTLISEVLEGETVQKEPGSLLSSRWARTRAELQPRRLSVFMSAWDEAGHISGWHGLFSIVLHSYSHIWAVFAWYLPVVAAAGRRGSETPKELDMFNMRTTPEFPSCHVMALRSPFQTH